MSPKTQELKNFIKEKQKKYGKPAVAKYLKALQEDGECNVAECPECDDAHYKACVGGKCTCILDIGK